MNPLRYIPHYTYDDYKYWEGDWELINGIPYALHSSPSIKNQNVWKHQSLGARLIQKIMNGLEKNCKEFIAVYNFGWLISEETIVRPDIMIVNKPTSDILTFTPLLIIEIKSPLSSLNDQYLKFGIYQKQKVKYYIIADPDSLTYKIFAIGNNGYVETTSENFLLHKNCSLKLNLAAILKSSK